MAVYFTAEESHLWVLRYTEFEAQHAAATNEPGEAKPAGEWRDETGGIPTRHQQVFYSSGGVFLGKLHLSCMSERLGTYYAYRVGTGPATADYFDTEAEAKAWVEEQCQCA